MKRIFAIPFLLVGMLLLTVSCNEELQIATYDQEAPSIASFTPTTGPVGTLVTVRGAGLHRIEKAYINDAEVEIRYAISGNEIVLRTTTAGSTGPISLEGPDGTARSAEIFTYTYPTPEITTYPESFTVGDEVVFFGTGLDGILNVRFDTVEGEIVDQRSTELVVKVPDLRIPEADITFSYFDGSSVVSFVHSGAEIVREVPKVDQLTPSGTVEVGTDITATGSFLHLVEQIKVGDVEARIVSQPENGQSLTFRILDDPSFPDGVNTLPLVFYSFNGSEVLDVQEQFSFLVPKFYTWRNANLNAHSVQKLNHFFCLDTGETYSADDFAEKVDPLTMSLGGGVCVAKNVLSPEVTAEQYYAVKPYIFFAYLGSGCYFYGAANNNNRLSNFKTSSGSALLTSGQAYGTPIILYRTLCEAEPAEKALIDKIKGGNFTNDDFSADLLDGNYFFGRGVANTGGVRIIGERHRVFNNYFEELAGRDQRSAISLVRGVENSELYEYFQVRDAQVVFNTIVNCRSGIMANTGSSTGTMPVVESLVAANLIVGNASGAMQGETVVADPAPDIRWEGNHVYGVTVTGDTDGGVATAPGFDLERRGATYVLRGESAGNYDKVSGFGYVATDITGAQRPDAKTPGAHEPAAENPTRTMPTRESAGVTWQSL